MLTFNKLFRKIKSTIINVLHTTSVTKATFAAKRNMKNSPTVIALIKGMTLGKITAIDDFINFLENNRPNFKLRMRAYKV